MIDKEECITRAVGALEQAEFYIESPHDSGFTVSEAWNNLARTWVRLAEVVDNG